MSALTQMLEGDLAHVRSRFVEGSSTSESMDDKIVTVKRRLCDVDEVNMAELLVGLRRSTQ